MSNYSSFLHDNRFIIFLFHGVIPRQNHTIRNYTNKHLVLDRFVSIVRDLCSNGTPVSMTDIVGANDNSTKLPDRAFAITFDDGFENNYSVAAPVLHALGVPATFYITTGFVESNTLSWIDIIEYAVEKRDKFHLALPFDGLKGTYETYEQKMELLDQIRWSVKNGPHIDPYEIAHDVCKQLDIEMIEADPDLDQKMNWEQVRELSKNPLFTIGGHSHTHRILAYLDQSELEYEITTSLEKLRTCLGAAVKHYSYPEGLAHCYSDRVVDELRRCGVVCALTAEHGMNSLGDDLFHLKRVIVV